MRFGAHLGHINWNFVDSELARLALDGVTAFTNDRGVASPGAVYPSTAIVLRHRSDDSSPEYDALAAATPGT